MEPNNKKPILNVTDLTAYLYCPRKFYLERIKGLKKPPTKAMIEGRIIHEIMEAFSNQERELIRQIETRKSRQEIINDYNLLLNKLINYNFDKNKRIINVFGVSEEKLKEKILKKTEKDISLRTESVAKTIGEGFLGMDLWENLKPKYSSEFSILSEKLRLKGKIDRVMISGDDIIPFELKTREIQKIYPSDEVQLGAYAMLLEDKFQKKIPLGILEAGNEKHDIVITDELKQKILNLIEEIRDILNNLKYPSNFAKCQKCDWEKECSQIKTEEKENKDI